MKHLYIGIIIGLALYWAYSLCWTPIASHVSGGVVEVNKITNDTRIVDNR